MASTNELNISGILHLVYDTVNVSDTFKKREFVVRIDKDVNGTTYSEYAKFQAVQTKCESLDNLPIGSIVEVKFNLSGKPWEKDGKTSYFTNLTAWSIKVTDANGYKTEAKQDYQPVKKDNPHALPPLPPKKDNKPQIADNNPDDLPF